MAGRLYLIGTPIGNLSDLSPRALATLAEIDLLYCEDTRTTAKLLNHFSLQVRTAALSDDAPDTAWREAVVHVKQGLKVGYVSEAGMPGLSDPGRRLVRAAWEAGETPIVIPGPSAVGTLLAACPFVTKRFRFLGFAPRKASERTEFIAELQSSPEPCFFFESPHRAHELLDEITTALEPGRELMIGREMTKMFEQLLPFTAADWARLRDDIPQVGEFTIAVNSAAQEKQDVDSQDVTRKLELLIEGGFSRRDAIKAVATVLELHPNDVKRVAYGDES